MIELIGFVIVVVELQFLYFKSEYFEIIHKIIRTQRHPAGNQKNSEREREYQKILRGLHHGEVQPMFYF